MLEVLCKRAYLEHAILFIFYHLTWTLVAQAKVVCWSLPLSHNKIGPFAKTGPPRVGSYDSSPGPHSRKGQKTPNFGVLVLMVKKVKAVVQ